MSVAKIPDTFLVNYLHDKNLMGIARSLGGEVNWRESNVIDANVPVSKRTLYQMLGNWTLYHILTLYPIFRPPSLRC